MIGDNFEGVTWYDEDHDGDSFKIRAGGTGEFVSLVDSEGEMNLPPGRRVELVVGCDNSPVSSFASVAQLVEQLTCNQQVVGSSPVVSSTTHVRR